MPLIAGPDRYQPMGDVDNCWMKQFVAENRGDCLDIYGMHYYPKHREIFDALKFELSLIGDRPFWATEPHWDAKDGEMICWIMRRLLFVPYGIRQIWVWMDLCGGAISVRGIYGGI